MGNILSKKLISAGGGMGALCYIAGMVASGGLTVPVGLVFAGLISGISAFHIHAQGKVDVEKAANS
jgi:hypothetical protein